MAEIYTIFNGPAPTTAAQALQVTSATLATQLQVKLGSTLVTPRAKVIEWGVSFDGFAAAAPFACELMACATAATVSAHVAAGIINSDPNATAPTDGFPFQLTTITTGYLSSTETAPSGVRMFDAQMVAPTNQYFKQFPLGRETGQFKVAEYLRLRVWGDGTRKCLCYVVIEL